VTAETLIQPMTEADESRLSGTSDRRLDIEAKMPLAARLLQQTSCEGLLLLEPENVAWLTSGAMDRGRPDPASAPAVYCNGEQRWVVCSNMDSQRLFDEELDGLGFQLKEWPWHWGREQLLADICQNRRVACDRPILDTRPANEALRTLRRTLTVYEQACYLALGKLVSHALEAACRNLSLKETERDVAGQIGHRLMHRGALPLHVGVAADGRSRFYRNGGFTSTEIKKYALLTATARKYGLVATASRSVCFGTLDEDLRKEQNAVCRVNASYLASTWPEAVPREILNSGRRIYQLGGCEHEWRLVPQGWLTGRLPVELPLAPHTEELFRVGWAVTWNVTAGAACNCDTYLITEQGPRALTPVENWPVKRIRIQGTELICPDILIRDAPASQGPTSG
jgi:Xaa-Pro dipeptidase